MLLRNPQSTDTPQPISYTRLTLASSTFPKRKIRLSVVLRVVLDLSVIHETGIATESLLQFDLDLVQVLHIDLGLVY